MRFRRKFLRNITIFIFLLLSSIAAAEEQVAPGMTQQKLHDLIVQVGDEVVISGNVLQFSYEGRKLLCVYDINADRMRIISPIAKVEDVETEQLLLALTANFHTVLDARYAISDGIVYAAYIHPLSPLSDAELVSAVRQVANAGNNFGDTYSSGELFYRGSTVE